MQEFNAEIRRDIQADVTIIDVSGTLDIKTASQLWTLLGKCLAECPAGVVVDLRRIILFEPLALTVFAAARLAHRRDLPDVALFVWSAPDLLDRDGARAALGTTAHPVTSLAEALEAIAASRRVMRRFTAELPLSVEAPAVARQLVLEACEFFAVDHVAGPAQLVVSELVSNAVQHARSISHLEIQLRARFLHLRVSDRSATPPIEPGDQVVAPDTPGGRGLWLVGRHSSGWGWRPTPDGKLVWATIRLIPIQTAA